MALNGFGLGLVMPVMLVAIQNAVEPRDMGVGTASVSFFRTMGGSFGVALYGAVLIARLDILFADLPGAADIARLMGGSPGVVLLHGGRHALDRKSTRLNSSH